MICTNATFARSAFIATALLEKHLFKEHGINRTNKSITCKVCGKGFDRKQLLIKHLKRTKCGLSEAKEYGSTRDTGNIVLQQLRSCGLT